MSTDRGLSRLAIAIAEWGGRIGAVNLNLIPGVWVGTTEARGKFGPLTVKVNAHMEENEGIPPYTFVVHPEGNPLSFTVMVNPYGGQIIRAGMPDGSLEDALIEHFNALAQPEAA